MKQKRKEEITIVWLGEEDLKSAHRLASEFGGLRTVQFELGRPNFNPIIPDTKIAVREIVRAAALQERGYQWSHPTLGKGFHGDHPFINGHVIGYDMLNHEIFRGPMGMSPDRQYIEELLLPPLHQSYTWHDVAYWRIEGFHKLHKLHQSGTKEWIMLIKAGVLLFGEEMERLSAGEIITPQYWGGLNGLGIIEDVLDTYSVREGCLYRVWAHLID